MGTITRFILIAIIVILALVFISNEQGTTICFGCEDRECKCAGYVNDNDVCVGVPYSCEKIDTNDEPSTKVIVIE